MNDPGAKISAPAASPAAEKQVYLLRNHKDCPILDGRKETVWNDRKSTIS